MVHADVPDDPTAYKRQEYWEERYATEESFDWFKTYEDLKPLLSQHIASKDARILMLGCGNSTLSEDMYDDGYHNIVNIDFSKTVIENMAEKCKDREGMEWIEMDIKDLKFEDGSFDIAIDKGTMDALMCDRGDVWNPDEELVRTVAQEVDEVVRVLKIGGKFLYITFGQPHFRKRHLERPCWTVETSTLGVAFHYFFYHMIKQDTPSS